MQGWQSSFAKSGEQTAQSIEDKWICQFDKLKSRVVTPVVTTFIVVDNKLSKSSIGIVVICSQKYISKSWWRGHLAVCWKNDEHFCQKTKACSTKKNNVTVKKKSICPSIVFTCPLMTLIDMEVPLLLSSSFDDLISCCLWYRKI